MATAQKLKEIRAAFNLSQAEFASALGLTREMVNKMESGKCGVSKATKALLQQFLQEKNSEPFPNSEQISHDVHFEGYPHPEPPPSFQPYVEQRRNQKYEKADSFVPLVGVKAQAGYVKDYEAVDFIDALEKYSLPPGVKPGGAQWSYFEVDGDSMEPTFSPGDVILASMVHAEDWSEIKNFSVYVIHTSDSLLVKRIYRKSDTEWVLLSDNDEAYPQRILSVSDVKELWIFRRHIAAKAPAPKEFSITV